MSHNDTHNSLDATAVERFLGGVARLDRVARAAAHTLPLLAGSVVLVVGAMFLDARFPMGSEPRLALAIVCIGIALWTLARLCAALAPPPSSKRRQSLSGAARMAERRLRIDDSRLINAIQLKSADSPGARAAIIRLQLRALESITGVPPRSMVRWRPALRSGAALGGSIVLVAVVALAFPRLVRLVGPRFVAPFADHPPFTWTDFAISIEPDEVTIGEDARIVVETRGELPAALRLAIFDERGSPLGSIEMSPGSAGGSEEALRFTAVLRSVQHPLRMFAEGDTGRSRSVDFAPVPRPRLLAATARAINSAQQAGASTPLRIGDGAAGNRLAVASGTIVEIRLDCSIPPARLAVQGGGGVEWQIDGSIARALVSVEQGDPVSLSMRAVSEEGLASRDAVSIMLEPVEPDATAGASGVPENLPMLPPANATASAGADIPVASASDERGADQAAAATSSGGSSADPSEPNSPSARESQKPDLSRGGAGVSGQGAEGVKADGSVPRAGDQSAEDDEGARRAGEPAPSSATRPGLGEPAAENAPSDGAALARVPEAYRELVGRYFSIVAARERERRESDAPKPR